MSAPRAIGCHSERRSPLALQLADVADLDHGGRNEGAGSAVGDLRLAKDSAGLGPRTRVAYLMLRFR